MKNFAVLFGLTLISSYSFAATDQALAVDAVSKFSQIGSAVCVDKTGEMQILGGSKTVSGAHTESKTTISNGSETYEVTISDGKVTAVTLLGTSGS